MVVPRSDGRAAASVARIAEVRACHPKGGTRVGLYKIDW